MDATGRGERAAPRTRSSGSCGRGGRSTAIGSPGRAEFLCHGDTVYVAGALSWPTARASATAPSRARAPSGACPVPHRAAPTGSSSPAPHTACTDSAESRSAREEPRRSVTSGVLRHHDRGARARPGSPWSDAGNLAGADARGARVDPATGARGDERLHGLDVRVPTARRAAVRVRHRHTETGPLATHIAHGSHG